MSQITPFGAAGEPSADEQSSVLTLGRRVMQHWWTRQVFVPWFFTRLVLTLIGMLSFYMLPSGSFSEGWQINGKGEIVPQPQLEWVTQKRWFVNIWSRWDSTWYYSVAHDGYQRPKTTDPNAMTNLNFFPVYPMLMRGVRLLGDDRPVRYFEMGILLSNVATLGALTLLVMLARLDFDSVMAGRSALSLMVFPTTCMLSAVYAEGLFTLLIIGSFYAARRERWWVAGALGMVAAATRAPGFVLAVGLAAEYLQQRGWRWRAIRWNVLAIGLVPLGLAAFLFYQRYVVAPGAGVESGYAVHKRFITWPWRAFAPFFDGTYGTLRWENSLFDLGFAIFALVTLLLAIGRLRASYWIFGLATWLFISCTNSISGMPRFVLPMFPIFLMLGLGLRWRWFEQGYLILGGALAALVMALFCTWHSYP